MTDKELLEFAAKAAGIELVTWTNMYDACDEIGACFIVRPHGEPWNPLTEDGDALRLAVKLELDIEQQHDCVYANGIDPIQNYQLLDWNNGDRTAATRRAIVRAAASIGEQA